MSRPALVFVDTNVFVYRLDDDEGHKQRQADAWLRELWTQRTGRVSYQVMQELYVTLTRKLSSPLTSERARSEVDSLAAWKPLPIDARVFREAWAVEDRYGFSWWDAAIVAAARITECRYLLTEDLQHGQELGALTVVDPFRSAPDDLS